MSAFAIIFWFSLAVLFYTFAGYPLLMHCLARLRAAQPASPTHEPRSAGVPPAGSASVPLGEGTGGETPPPLAAGDGCATVVCEFRGTNRELRQLVESLPKGKG